jgi:hypothetical protein
VPTSPAAGRVLIALADGPITPAPTWTRFDNLSSCRCPGYDIRTGRQSELDLTDTGTARVYFKDRNRTTDDPSLVGRQIMLQVLDPNTSVWEPQFRGVIDNLVFDVNPRASMSEVTFECVDLFDYLGGVRFLPGVMGDVTPASVKGVVFYEDGPADDRATSILADVGLDPAWYQIFTLNIEVNETTYGPDEVALQALRDTVDAEFPGIANIYVDRFGRLAIHGRKARFDPDTVSAGAGDEAWDFQRWDAATREDVVTGSAQIREFRYSYPRSRIINAFMAWPRADELGYTFKPSLIDGQVRRSTTSIAAYGYRGRQFPDLVIKKLKPAVGTSTGAEQCGLFGDFYIANYNVPRLNVDAITFKALAPYAGDVSAATWALMTQADISDIIALTVDEAGLAAEEFYIEGFSKEVRYLNPDMDMMVVSPNLSPTAYYGTDVFTAT